MAKFMNNKAEMKIATVLMWVLIIGAVAYVANFGGFKDTINGILGTSTPTPTPTPVPNPSSTTLTETADCPTSGITTYTINAQDALATTATAVYPEYYVFNGNMLIKEGTLASDANTVSLTCGKDYQVLLVNTTAHGEATLYGKVVDLKARIAQQTLNVGLVRAGEGIVYKVFNQQEGVSSERYANMTLGKATTKNWGIQFGANSTAKGFNKPIILCDANSTEILKMDLSSFSGGDGTITKPNIVAVPKRITATTGRSYYAWEYPAMHDLTQPIITGIGSLTSTTTGPVAASSSNMTCKIVDQATWKLAAYKTATSIDEGFKTGPENTETLADVGAEDSSPVTMVFVNDKGL